ncbi:hypothetical protein PFISCL1PPCAC_22013, partial [Pristionchus fissidentatus]
PMVGENRLINLSNVKHFTTFHKALICMDRNRAVGNSFPETGLNSIGLIAAHIIEMPPPPEYFDVIKTKIDKSDSTPRRATRGGDMLQMLQLL